MSRFRDISIFLMRNAINIHLMNSTRFGIDIKRIDEIDVKHNNMESILP